MLAVKILPLSHVLVPHPLPPSLSGWNCNVYYVQPLSSVWLIAAVTVAAIVP